MLVFRQENGQPMLIGDAVVYVTAEHGRVRVAIDAPPYVQVKRGDVLERTLTHQGWSRVNDDTWIKGGSMVTTQEALALIRKPKETK
jgi:sRNA-binding carbon storage regulator CsrA